MTSVVRPSTGLPPQARHEACRRLVGLGLYREAQSLLSTERPEDAELGILTCLLAADPRSAAKFLGRRMMASAARPGEVELVRGCITLVSGRPEGMETASAGLAAAQPLSQDRTMFAVAVAPYDLEAAARVAVDVADPKGPAVLAVLAAARAAAGDVRGAHTLLAAVGWAGVGENPVLRTGELLRMNGLERVLQELEAIGRQRRRTFGEAFSDRMTGWRRRREERDLRCRCASTPVFAGDNSRHYVSWHLELDQRIEDPKGWRILVCQRSGVRFLDRSSVPVSVRIS